MTPPLMNTDYSSEVGTIKDYREQAPFCAGSEQRDHKNDRATFHLHMVEEPRSFLSSTSPTTRRLPFFYYTLDSLPSLLLRPMTIRTNKNLYTASRFKYYSFYIILNTFLQSIPPAYYISIYNIYLAYLYTS